MKVEEILVGKIEIIENIRVKEDPDIKNLMESIKQHGLKEPIGVGTTKSGKYVLIYGYRRLLAYKKLGYKHIPAVLENEPEISELLVVNTIENLQRRDITPIELGRICIKLLELGLTPGEIAAKIGISKAKIEGVLQIYKHIPEHLRNRIRFMPPGHAAKKGDIPASVAHEVLNLRRRYSVSNGTIEELLEEVRLHELGKREMSLIGSLISTGMTPAMAVKTRRNYVTTSVELLFEKEKLNSLVKKYNMSPNEIFRGIVSGKIRPIPLFSDTLRLLSRKKEKLPRNNKSSKK